MSSTTCSPRITMAEAPFSAPITEALARIMPPGVTPLALFRSVAVNERVFLRMMAGGLLDRGSITLRDRELVIHRTCARLGAEYEWGVHVAFFAPKAEMTPAQIAATLKADLTDSELSARDQMLFALVDALVDTATVDDALWEKLAATWSQEQLVELVALVGYYHQIAFTANALRVPLETFGARFAAYQAGEK